MGNRGLERTDKDYTEPRVSLEERERFHVLVDACINKMNRPKNRKKTHWCTLTPTELQKKVNIENAELEEAVFNGVSEGIMEECYDLINLNLMILDNIM